ncbi:MAG TPA: DUF1553 domain-containing protein [Thermoanaerobaculia bacterium]|nr:DUF1553 domain-containing protein [Thermoanaerobaculia bacterium]
MRALVALLALLTSFVAAAQDCTYDPARVAGPRQVMRRLSQTAEAVAPSSSHRRTSTAPAPPKYPIRNFIDTEVFGLMERDGIAWTSISSDEEFLRRVTVDLTGQIPDAATVRAFLADTSADKREHAIDRLLHSEEYVDRWTLWLGDLVQNVQSASNTILFEEGRDPYYFWMRDSIRANKPYDQMVREMLATDGGSFHDGPANYVVRQWQNNGPIQDTYDNLSAHSGEKFLGVTINCLSCHNGLGHLEQVNPSLVKRTRQEFWRNAAFFAQITLKNANSDDDYEWKVGTNPAGSYQLNTTSGNKTVRAPTQQQSSPVLPAFLLTGETPKDGENRRVAYARMLTAHPQFARATVNYLWKEIFGMGLVEPADNFDLTAQDTQPTHPALLAHLAEWFAASGYDIRALLRLMVNSSAYQLSSRYTPGAWQESYTRYYARHYPRRMLSESVLDAVARATNVPISIRVPLIEEPFTRAMALPDTREPFVPQRTPNPYKTILDTFGRGDRDTNARTREGSIAQALEMLNDPVITTRVKTRIDTLLASTHDPGAIADELYLATLSRKPKDAERAAAIAYLQDGDLKANAEDLQFVLINRLEFLFN